MSKAIKIYNVTVDIHRPTSAGDPGTVAEGRYTVTDDVVTLVDHAGKPVRDKDGIPTAKNSMRGSPRM